MVFVLNGVDQRVDVVLVEEFGMLFAGSGPKFGFVEEK